MRSFLCCWCPSLHRSGKEKEAQDAERRDIAYNRRTIKYIVCGGLSLALGCLSFIWTPYDWMKDETLKMRRGLLPYHWWLTPPEVLLKVHVFNVTNYDEIMSGSETTLKVKEVGPFIYHEQLVHTNVRKNDNGTMTYLATRHLKFAPELNTLSLNDTVIVPNLAFLGMSSYVSEWPFFVRLGFNLLSRRYDPEPLMSISVYDLLWNNTDPMLQMAYKVLPSMMPTTNIGYLQMMYANWSDESTVFLGPDHPRKYFTMNKFHGRDRFGIWPNESCDTVDRATEGVLYHHSIEKTDQLHFFRKSLCRVMPIAFKEEVETFGMTAYNFSLPLDTFHRSKNGTDCYTYPGKKPLPDGLSDVARCFYDFPIVASFPHFVSVNSSDLPKLEGYEPNPDIHGAFSVVEPVTGTPLQSKASMQCNLKMRDVSAFNRAAPFSNMYIPLFWIQLYQEDIPPLVKTLLYCMVVLTPALQGFFSAFLVALGVALLYFRVIKTHKPRTVKCTYTSLDPIPRAA